MSFNITPSGQPQEASITIPADKHFVKPYIGFLQSFAHEISVDEGHFNQFIHALDDVLNLIVDDNAKSAPAPGISINSRHTADSMTVEILNHGRPLFLDQAQVQSRLPQAKELQGYVTFENRGRNGQVITLRLGPVGEPAKQVKVVRDLGEAAHTPAENVTIRQLRRGEEAELSRLFHAVYGYDYINEFVYFPEQMKKMLEQEDLISIVAALPDGRLIGHVGLIRWNKEPVVYEAALGVVDPTVKSRGLFSQLFQHAMEVLKPVPMQYCIFDFVTNHDFTQRLVTKFNYSDMALYLGNQVSATQARLEQLGIGQDPLDTDRYSLLVGVRPQTAYPFGREVVLPVNLGEPCDFILKPLNVSWIPAPRFYPLAAHGEYKVTLQKEQKSAIFDFHTPGRQALEGILNEWRQLLREGYQYFAIDFPLNKPGIGQAYDQLSQHGFFMGGFIPWHFSDTLGFRFQFLIPTKVNFNEIKIFSETGRRILKMVREDYERNKIL